jgi:hypothetical protein
MAVRFSALRANSSEGRFPVLIFVTVRVDPQGHSAAGRITPIEKSKELIGNRIRYATACSEIPQHTKLPLAPM